MQSVHCEWWQWEQLVLMTSMAPHLQQRGV